MGRTLSEHAAYELMKAGLPNNEDPEARKVAHDTMALVKRFEKQEHNQTTGRITLEIFESLCNFIPLTALTDSPDEWDKFEIETKNTETGEVTKETRWQSKRGPSIISADAGKTWVDQRSGKSGTSTDHTKVAEAPKDDVPAAEAPAPNVLTDTPAPTATPLTKLDEKVAEQTKQPFKKKKKIK